MTVKAKFKGKNGSRGYAHGETYILRVYAWQDGLWISKPYYCQYDSFGSFLENWEIIE